MRYFARRHLIWACAILLIEGTRGYPMFQERIPNGNRVPHPCKANFIWNGVGHENPLGGGVRNAFGLDFKSAGEQWSVELCRKDSDGDGKTNGEELGDPNCVWSTGQSPSRSTGLSHPGICDPMYFSQCDGKNNWVQCPVEEFKCPTINDIETKNITVRFPVNESLQRETTHMCMQISLPQDGDYHLFASKAIIDDANAIHHVVVYGCKNEGSRIPLNQPYICDTESRADCTDIIGLWRVGISGQCHHNSSGFRIGVNGYKRAKFQFYWVNREMVNRTTNSFGMTLYYTPKLRPYDAGVLVLGQTDIAMPHGKNGDSAVGICPGECTRKLMTGSIHIITAHNYMQDLGIQQRIELYRNGSKLQDVAFDDNNDNESPVNYNFVNPIEIKPGDELKTTCIFWSTSQFTMETYGKTASQIMCYSFIPYFPKENFPNPDCIQWNNISICDWDKEVIQGCRHKDILKVSIPQSADIYKSVIENCVPLGKCQKECLRLVKNIKRHPCFHGDMDKFQRIKAVGTDDPALKSKLLEFYAALDSCNVELALEAAGANDSKLRILEGP